MTAVEPIVVVVAADSAFAKQLAVVIASISKFARREHRVFVLHDGYEAVLIDQVSEMASGEVSLSWLDARSIAFDDAILPPTMVTASLFRLRMGTLLPQSIERVIFLDADVVVRRPLDELWETDLDGCALAAVRDSMVLWAGGLEGFPWQELGIAPDVPYFNAGVMVIDMDRWRTQRIGERALELLSRHRFPFGDQCALNAALSGQSAQIAPQWNLQSGTFSGECPLACVVESQAALASAVDDPAIVHFTHSLVRKPWQYNCTHPYRDLWFEYLDLTNWHGWRPPVPTRPSRARSAVRRIRKAGEVLLRG
jgi:lipopolysaccharide biosynthesis glycosyltransferase